MKKQLVISTSNDMLRISPDKIVYILADGNYSTLVQSDNNQFVLSYQLGQIEKLDYKASFHTSMFNIVVMFGVLMTVLIRPEAEIWYYGASVLMLVLVVLNFNEILNNYNYLAMRKMPQFRKKG